VRIAAVPAARSTVTFTVGRRLPRLFQIFAGGKLLFPPFDDADSLRPRRRAGAIGRGWGLSEPPVSSAHPFDANTR
jgi:hypothetical protein